MVDLHYIAPLDEVDCAIEAHVEFLEKNYASGCFIASGPKIPRTGGVIIATAATRATLEQLLDEDPFKQQGLAQYRITEFRASMRAEPLKVRTS